MLSEEKMTLYSYIQEHLFGKGFINEQQSQMSSFRIPNKPSSLTPLLEDSVEPHGRYIVPPSCRPSLHYLQLITVLFVSCEYMEALSPWKPSGQASPEMISPLLLFYCKFSFLLSASNIQKLVLPRFPSGHIWQELRSILYQETHSHQTFLKSREINCSLHQTYYITFLSKFIALLWSVNVQSSFKKKKERKTSNLQCFLLICPFLLFSRLFYIIEISYFV